MRKKNPLLQVQSDPLHVRDGRDTELKEIDHEIECRCCQGEPKPYFDPFLKEIKFRFNHGNEDVFKILAT